MYPYIHFLYYLSNIGHTGRGHHPGRWHRCENRPGRNSTTINTTQSSKDMRCFSLFINEVVEIIGVENLIVKVRTLSSLKLGSPQPSSPNLATDRIFTLSKIYFYPFPCSLCPSLLSCFHTVRFLLSGILILFKVCTLFITEPEFQHFTSTIKPYRFDLWIARKHLTQTMH